MKVIEVIEQDMKTVFVEGKQWALMRQVYESFPVPLWYEARELKGGQPAFLLVSDASHTEYEAAYQEYLKEQAK